MEAEDARHLKELNSDNDHLKRLLWPRRIWTSGR